MKINVIGSGSKGNCIIVSTGEHNIMLDCGISLKKLQEAQVRFSDISACLITHAHGDHAKYASKLLEKAVPLFMTMETCNLINMPTNHHNINLIQGDLTPIVLDEKVVIMAFPLIHDIEGHVGFIIKIPETKKNLVYITDSGAIPFMFKGMTHLIIECNYTDKAMLNAIDQGVTNRALARRIVDNHLGLHQVEGFLKALTADDDRLEEVHLVHVSDINASNEEIEALRESFPKLNIIIH